MKDTLLYMVRFLVDNPEEVTIEERMDGDATILIIHTNPSDIGKVIGKSGRIIRALRDLMKVLAAKANTFVDVEIAEDAAPQEVSA
ncbi:MAG: KH domain-containing protein [Patescibacteria group bacterium]